MWNNELEEIKQIYNKSSLFEKGTQPSQSSKNFLHSAGKKQTDDGNLEPFRPNQPGRDERNNFQSADITAAPNNQIHSDSFGSITAAHSSFVPQTMRDQGEPRLKVWP